jgi:DMSO/TMAO reductase YedYZ molybdopterin-dependent catalytic subunit
MNRREFLRIAAGSVILFFRAVCQSPNASPGTTAPPGSSLGTAPAPAARASASTPDPNVTPPRLDLPLPPEITPIERFYVTNYSGIIPGFDSQMWLFSLDGLVTRPRKFNYVELRALPAVEVMRALECIGNTVGGSLIGNAMWQGVSPQELLKMAEANMIVAPVKTT